MAGGCKDATPNCDGRGVFLVSHLYHAEGIVIAPTDVYVSASTPQVLTPVGISLAGIKKHVNVLDW